MIRKILRLIELVFHDVLLVSAQNDALGGDEGNVEGNQIFKVLKVDSNL